MNNPLYTIIFEDSSIFKGGKHYIDTKWLEIPNKKIKRIFYKTSNNDYICLNGYENFYHIVEAVQDLNGRERGKTKIEYAYIMGLKNNKVKSYRITLINKPFSSHKMGDITVREFDITDSKISKLNKIGWRPLLNVKK